MMTSACTIMGTLPIAIGFGADAGARRSLGLCVVGGLLFAQVVTLYVTPVFYTYMDSLPSGAAVVSVSGLPKLPLPWNRLLTRDAKHAGSLIQPLKSIPMEGGLALFLWPCCAHFASWGG